MRKWSGKHWSHLELARKKQTLPNNPPRNDSVDKTKTLIQDTQSPEKLHQKNDTVTEKTPDKIRNVGAYAKRPEHNISAKKIKRLRRQDAMLVKTLNLRHGKKVKRLKRQDAMLVKTLNLLFGGQKFHVCKFRFRQKFIPSLFSCSSSRIYKLVNLVLVLVPP